MSRTSHALSLLAGIAAGAGLAVLLAEPPEVSVHRIEFVPQTPTPDALATALYARYGNIDLGNPGVRVPDEIGPQTGFRPHAHWRRDAEAILTYLTRFPHG